MVGLVALVYQLSDIAAQSDGFCVSFATNSCDSSQVPDNPLTLLLNLFT